MINPIIWVYEDGLTPTHPGLVRWPGRPALFPLDEHKICHEGWTFKRVVFLYECALELPCEIARGNPVDLLDSFASQHEADGIVTMASLCPRHAVILKELRKIWTVEVYPSPSLLRRECNFDLRRFSRYWASAKDLLPQTGLNCNPPG